MDKTIRKRSRVKLLVGRVSSTRSRTMAAIRAKDTKAEVRLRKALFALGLRYRLHPKGMPGRPDIVFPTEKVAVFCDGDFWHGRKLKKALAKGGFRVRNKYWVAKLRANIRRDKRNNRDLGRLGWLVIRFWETDILRDVESIGPVVLKAVRARRRTLRR